MEDEKKILNVGVASPELMYAAVQAFSVSPEGSGGVPGERESIIENTHINKSGVLSIERLLDAYDYDSENDKLPVGHFGMEFVVGFLRLIIMALLIASFFLISMGFSGRGDITLIISGIGCIFSAISFYFIVTLMSIIRSVHHTNRNMARSYNLLRAYISLSVQQNLSVSADSR